MDRLYSLLLDGEEFYLILELLESLLQEKTIVIDTEMNSKQVLGLYTRLCELIPQ